MRGVPDTQRKLGQVPIEEMDRCPESKDDRPKTLLELQRLYSDRKARKKVFDVLEKHLCPGVRLRHGRPGMSLWRIFVLGVVKQANPYDFEKLTDEANNHDALRQMRGHASFLGRKRY